MSAGCARCRELESQVADLEQTLEGALFVLPGEVEKLRAVWPITKQQAEAVLVLYRAGANWVDWRTFDQAIPESDLGPRRRLDPEFRQHEFVRQTVFLIRQKVGADLIESRKWFGYRISQSGRQRVREILKASHA